MRTLSERPGAAVIPPAWLLVLVFVATWAFRLLSSPALLNDHFMHLAWANQVLMGELPVRDFVDPGMPLTYLVSAAAQWFLGRGLWAEVILSITMVAASATITCHLATRASGMVSVGVLAAVVQVIIAPRLYSAPKLLLHLWAVWAFWNYAEKRTRRSLLGLVACTVVAALTRHDHGVYISLAAVMLLLAVHWPRGWIPVATYAGLVVLVMLPFAVYVQANGGIPGYLRAGLAFSRAEYSGRRVEGGPRFDFRPVAPRTPHVNIRWAAHVEEATRVNLENEHRLGDAAQLSDRTWRYTLGDQSRANVRALVNRPEVEDTGGIDRGELQVVGLEDTIFTRLNNVAHQHGAAWLTGLLKRENAVAWLYLLFTGASWLALLLVACSWIRLPRARSSPGWFVDDPMPRSVVAATAVLAIATNSGFLRDQLDVRLADTAAVPLVLMAWIGGLIWHIVGSTKPRLTTLSWRPWMSGTPAAIVIGIAVVICSATFLSAAELGSLVRAVEETAIEEGPRSMMRAAAQTVRNFRAQPPIESWLGTGDAQREIKQLTKYVRDCTAPGDRLLVTWFAPEIYFFSERGFAAGLAFFYKGFFSSPAEEEIAVSRLRGQRVPIILVEGAGSELVDDHPLLAQELRHQYIQSVEVPASDGRRYRVFVDRRLSAVRTATEWNLPCFR